MRPRLDAHRLLRVAATLAASGLVSLGLAAAAQAKLVTHGRVVQIPKPGVGFNANQSSNWFGYNQGLLGQGGTQFHSITGDWTVPTATQHTPGQAGGSSTWVGIGGGCIDANCTLTDPTLIQTGTEQDVDSTGKGSYSAWWEIIPLPSTAISMTVAPGDHMHASVSETPAGSETWTITLQDLTRNESFSTTTPYLSDYTTAEWIEETPLEIASSGIGQASLPSLSTSAFDLGSVNGVSPKLQGSQQLQLVDQNGAVIAAPSGPDSDLDGFGLCAWATTCPVPPS